MENLKIMYKISLILAKKSKENILVTILFYFGSFIFYQIFFIKISIFIQFNFCHKLYTRISRKFFQKYLYKDYLFHTQNNSSELIRNIIGEGTFFIWCYFSINKSIFRNFNFCFHMYIIICL